MEWYNDEEINIVKDDKILEEYDDARSLMSYYNAAEGNWSSETTARNECSAYLRTVFNQIESRNLTPNKGSYLC